MAIMMKQFIEKFKAMEKVANETLAANPEALVGVDSLPGSEHDAKVPEDAKKPDEEVAQGQPAGATSAEGAVNGGDAKPLNEGKLELDEPLLNPEKKPLVTDDALTAKTANDHLVSLVKDLLADIKGGTQKQAQCGSAAPAAPAATSDKDKKDSKKKDEKVSKAEPEKSEKVAAQSRETIELNDEMLAKIAAAQYAFMKGREAAEALKKQASSNTGTLSPEDARKLIKEACVKAAQEQGLDPAAAAAAADNAMAVAGVPAPAEAAAADAGAAAADAGAAEAAAADADAMAGIPEDVTEEELATAIVDLVSSGELDPDTAKALVEEIAGDEGAAAPTDDEAAAVIAEGLENGQITPEQAQQIAAAVESGAAGDAGAAAGEADAAAAGAADAEAAAQDAKDEAAGAAAAEEAMKSAAAMIRKNTIAKVASKIVEKRASANPPPGSSIMSKVASILQAKKAEKAEKAEKENQAAAPESKEESEYIKGFKKKAEEMGIDPVALAKYVIESKAQESQAK